MNYLYISYLNELIHRIRTYSSSRYLLSTYPSALVRDIHAVDVFLKNSHLLPDDVLVNV